MFGSDLVQIRRELGITILELAAYMGLPPEYFVRLETRQRQPCREEIENIVAFLNDMAAA
jgi:transcriptional regulator with XRE-family HTH domain